LIGVENTNVPLCSFQGAQDARSGPEEIAHHNDERRRARRRSLKTEQRDHCLSPIEQQQAMPRSTWFQACPRAPPGWAAGQASHSSEDGLHICPRRRLRRPESPYP